MDDLEMEFNSSTPARIDDDIVNTMQATVGWMKFSAIAMLIMSGLGLFFPIMLIANGGYGSEFMAIALIVVITICVVWGVLMLNYANDLSKYCQTRNIPMLESAFRKQKAYFIFNGVMSILSILSTLYQFVMILQYL